MNIQEDMVLNSITKGTDLRSQAAERWASTVAGASKAVTVASWVERKSEEKY